MTKKLKQITKFMALCSLIILGGCTQEKDFVNEHNQRNIDFEEKSFKEALSLPLFNDAMQKVAKQRGALRSEDAAKTALEDQYGFSIVTDAPVRIITDENGTVFYTILIEREVKDELIFENLMIKVEDMETAAVILKYTMVEKGIITPTQEYIIKDIASTEYTDLNIEGRVFFNSNGDMCTSTNVVRCNDESAGEPAGHVAHAGCYAKGIKNNLYYLYNDETTVCDSGGGSGSGSSTGGPGFTTGSSNNTGGLGSSGGNNTPISLTPIPCRTGNCMEANAVVSPCVKLKQKFESSKGNIDSLIVELRGNLGNPGESGKSLRKDQNGVFSSVNSAVTANLRLKVAMGDYFYGSIHTHPFPGGVPMFS